MLLLTTLLKKFNEKGEKTGWIYIEIPGDLAEVLNPGVKTSFRVKGKIDNYAIRQIALLPMGDGSFILPTNSEIRKAIRKQDGASVKIELEIDDSPVLLSEDLMQCLTDAPEAQAFFNTLPKGHQNYFSKWIESAKTTETRVKRITQAVQALSMEMGYSEMVHYFRRKVEK